MRDYTITENFAKQELSSFHDPNLDFDLAKF